jgi:hypothetical protein
VTGLGEAVHCHRGWIPSAGTRTFVSSARHSARRGRCRTHATSLATDTCAARAVVDMARRERLVADDGIGFTFVADVADVAPGEPPPPLAVIIGFLGCLPRVAKAQARVLTESTGFDTAWVVPPAAVTFSATTAPKTAFASALADALTQPSPLGVGGVVLCSFSNSGAYVLQRLHAALSDPAAPPAWQQLFARVVGVVFDSGPCLFAGPIVGAAALLAGQPSAGAVADAARCSRALATSVTFWVSNFWRTGDADGGWPGAPRRRSSCSGAPA